MKVSIAKCLATASFAVLVIGCAPTAPTSTNSPPVDVAPPPVLEDVGLKVGTKAPEFALKDQAGQERSLAELRKKGLVAVVFYRSVRW